MSSRCTAYHTKKNCCKAGRFDNTYLFDPWTSYQDALFQLKAAVQMLYHLRDEDDCHERLDAATCLQDAVTACRAIMRAPLRLRAAAVVQEVGAGGLFCLLLVEDKCFH